MGKSKLLLGAACAYFAYEIYGVLQHCRPPRIRSEDPNAAHPQFKPTDKLRFEVYLFSEKKKADRYMLTSFDANPSWSTEFVDRNVVENFTVPLSNKNVTLMAEVVAYANGKEFDRLSMKLSRFQVPQDERDGKRNLVHDPSGGMLRRKIEEFGPPRPRSSIPKVVEVGFVLEEGALDGNHLRQVGLKDFVKGKHFKMPLYLNTFVSPRDEYVPLDASFDFEIRFRVIGYGYWIAQKIISDSMKEAEATMGMNSYDIDSFMQLISGSSPWKLIIVYTVAILHFIFEYLVITADINFWKAKTSFEGLSKSSITMGICMKLISVLYVIEDGKTKLVLYILFGRLSLDLWKWWKMHKSDRETWEQGLEEIRDISQSEKKLMIYTFIGLSPLICAFVLYRLVYRTFNSWYSFVILTLAASSQMFGLVVMLPQVFLNYRLKSVEHLPWRALSYQAVNTFIDDIFTFCIRMPEVQQYSVFRDDIVFLICLYQRYLYKDRRLDTTAGEKVENARVEDEKKLQ